MRQRYPWLVLLASMLVPPAAAAQVPADAPSWDGSGQIVMTRVSSSLSPFSSLFPVVELISKGLGKTEVADFEARDFNLEIGALPLKRQECCGFI